MFQIILQDYFKFYNIIDLNLLGFNSISSNNCQILFQKVIKLKKITLCNDIDLSVFIEIYFIFFIKYVELNIDCDNLLDKFNELFLYIHPMYILINQNN